MRSKKVFYNVISHFMLYATNSILGFIVRRIFIRHIGADILGINSVYNNILSLLSLSELGLGTLVAVFLYKPLAEGNKDKISAYMILLRKVYIIIGITIIAVGSALIPVVPRIIVADVENRFIYFSYFLYLMTIGTSYFFSYKRVLLIADQKGYIWQIISLVNKIILNMGYFLAIIYSKDYMIYLIVGLIGTILENVCIAFACDRLYPNICIKKNRLTLNEKRELKNKLKGMLCLRVGDYLINSTDNIIISKFVNTATVAYYTNYNLIIYALDAIGSSFASNVVSSFGNLLYTERHKVSITIKKIMLIQYFIYGISAPIFYVLSTDFVRLFFGEESILVNSSVILLSIIYYINGYMNGISLLRKSKGLYEKDQLVNIIVPILNIIVSILLVRKYSVSGVLIGTILCCIILKIIVTPIYTASEFTDFSLKEFYNTAVVHVGLTLCNTIVAKIICSIMIVNSMVKWFLSAIICLLVIITINFIIFSRNDIFVELYKHFKMVIKQLK